MRTKNPYLGPNESLKTDGNGWTEQYLRTINHAYARADYFSQYKPILETTYLKAADLPLLTKINELLLRMPAGLLEIETPSTTTNVVPRTASSPTNRLVEICAGWQATEHVSSPAARADLEPEKIINAGVALKYPDHSGYPVYEQHASAFEHGVGVLDLRMRRGPAAWGHFRPPSNWGSFVKAG